MHRQLHRSLLFVLSVVGIGSAATSVALAYPNHPSQPTEISTVQGSHRHNPYRPAWSKEMLNAHNQWRQSVGIPPLTWSDNLAKHAQEWANYLAKDNFKLYHRPNNPYGENLTWAAYQKLSPTQVVNMWGEEVKDYNYDTNRCSGVCGHYTQLVWENTTEVGCAQVRSGHQEVWVCNYNPPGNYRGQKPYQARLRTNPSFPRRFK
ncbi:CAP domain-containing protein [Acaryochloris sp. IP29b_bin.137]|uniref:CAP domain-containing protein n=1 Tax=Acaryochloris sp. IP29b_bin.137 TaxID=2969217 RepID=UPI0026176CDD|nr:CAP domain-containing protein [Acaryochloris sp. IP29b_bin.137]